MSWANQLVVRVKAVLSGAEGEWSFSIVGLSSNSQRFSDDFGRGFPSGLT
jgi:hypothetical protein